MDAQRGFEEPVSPATSRRMRSNKSKDTAPEMALRVALHAMGLRYRVHYRALPNERLSIDVAFTRSRVAVFMDGCFWHGCPEHYRPANVRAEFWADKIRENIERDRRTDKKLADNGWVVVRAWEHERIHDVVARVESLVRERSGRTDVN